MFSEGVRWWVCIHCHNVQQRFSVLHYTHKLRCPGFAEYDKAKLGYVAKLNAEGLAVQVLTVRC